MNLQTKLDLMDAAKKLTLLLELDAPSTVVTDQVTVLLGRALSAYGPEARAKLKRRIERGPDAAPSMN